MSEQIKLIKMKSGGSIVYLNLEDYHGVQSPRSFKLEPRRETPIPINYALSLFTYDGIDKMYNSNIISITFNEKEFLALLSEDGEAPDPEDKIADSVILATLYGNNITAIKKLIEGEKGARVRDLAIENKGNISHAILKEIEAHIGLVLTD